MVLFGKMNRLRQSLKNTTWKHFPVSRMLGYRTDHRVEGARGHCYRGTWDSEQSRGRTGNGYESKSVQLLGFPFIFTGAGGKRPGKHNVLLTGLQEVPTMGGGRQGEKPEHHSLSPSALGGFPDVMESPLGFCPPPLPGS